MLIKICGLTNHIDAFNAVEAGATDLGFVMGGKVLPYEIEPLAQQVREMIKKLPPSVNSYIVTHLMEAEDIVDLANYVNSSGIQVSEDVGAEVMQKVRKDFKKKIIKTIVVEPEYCFKKMKDYEPYCDFFLLDSRVAGYTGGTGAVNDWDLCKKLIQLTQKPCYLAGGLNPQNLKEAMEIAQPAGVDVSTGVSCYSDDFLRKDRKDKNKIQQFIKEAKNYECSVF